MKILKLKISKCMLAMADHSVQITLCIMAYTVTTVQSCVRVGPSERKKEINLC